MKETRVSTNYAFSREQKRYIARQNAKNKQDEDTKQVLTARMRAKKEEKWKIPAGKKYFKHEIFLAKDPKTNMTYHVKNPSYFAEHWKEFIEVTA